MAYPFDRPQNVEFAQSVSSNQADIGAVDETAPPASTPPIDVYDDDEEIRVYVDLPGFDAEEIQVQGDETNLVIRGERSQRPEESARPVVQERARAVERTIPLHAPVDVSEAVARHHDGVCEVVLPKTAAGQYREISLHSD
jgi:HSP20 family protein